MSKEKKQRLLVEKQGDTARFMNPHLVPDALNGVTSWEEISSYLTQNGWEEEPQGPGPMPLPVQALDPEFDPANYPIICVFTKKEDQ